MNRVIIVFLAVSYVSSFGMFDRGNCHFNNHIIIENGVRRCPNSDEMQQIQTFNMEVNEWGRSQNAYWHNVTGNQNRGENNQIQDVSIKPQPPCLCATQNCQ